MVPENIGFPKRKGSFFNHHSMTSSEKLGIHGLRTSLGWFGESWIIDWIHNPTNSPPKKMQKTWTIFIFQNILFLYHNFIQIFESPNFSTEFLLNSQNSEILGIRSSSPAPPVPESFWYCKRLPETSNSWKWTVWVLGWWDGECWVTTLLHPVQSKVKNYTYKYELQ